MSANPGIKCVLQNINNIRMFKNDPFTYIN